MGVQSEAEIFTDTCSLNFGQVGVSALNTTQFAVL